MRRGRPVSTVGIHFNMYLYLNEVDLPLLLGKHFNMYLDTSIVGNEVGRGMPLLLGKHFNMYPKFSI
jgi:hypothetical protein